MKVTVVKDPTGLPMDNRWCEACKSEHGPLYLCPHYPDELKAVVLEADALYRAALTKIEPRTRNEAVQLAILKAFAGADPAEEA
jgi:hypothetical protein